MSVNDAIRCPESTVARGEFIIDRKSATHRPNPGTSGTGSMWRTSCLMIRCLYSSSAPTAVKGNIGAIRTLGELTVFLSSSQLWLNTNAAENRPDARALIGALVSADGPLTSNHPIRLSRPTDSFFRNGVGVATEKRGSPMMMSPWLRDV